MLKEIIKKFVPSFLLGWYHYGLAFLGALIYRFPSKGMIVIGITGTKGKSTVVEFCHRILRETGYNVASLSSIRFKIKDKERPNTLKMTMPGRFKIQKFFRQAKNEGCKYMILEVTSEGILQHRHQFINFDTAVFTNLALEHIERHGSFENYRKAKGKLFKKTKKVHIINIDDENSGYFLQFGAEKKYTYGLDQGEINNRDIRFNLKMVGDFNIYNALAATCVGLSQGVSIESCKKTLENIEGIPGRMELVISQPFKVIVDYAHTPDSLEGAYETSIKLKTQNSKLICVLGSAGGGRDTWKRPKMGEIAAKYCNEIILTNEDPYDENPEKIIKEVGSKIQNYKSILDRREAIREALKNAEPGDTLIITGKGCEPWMCVAGGKKIPWDDREIVREEFDKIHNVK